ncbi:EF-hand domain-containing protein [Haloferula chungangensis]|uniref:EF-hand domain-containing protein n=1 Tax=Haloferula chungangensis TaxID=1048331 RepID=A0ABW2L1Z9_9BACT
MKALIAIPLGFLVASCSSTASRTDPQVVGRKMIGLQEKFDLIDTDGDGFLTRSEIVAGFSTVGVVDQSPETVDAIVDFYDFDKDGKLTLRETQSGAVTGPEALIREYREKKAAAE